VFYSMKMQYSPFFCFFVCFYLYFSFIDFETNLSRYTQTTPCEEGILFVEIHSRRIPPKDNPGYLHHSRSVEEEGYENETWTESQTTSHNMRFFRFRPCVCVCARRNMLLSTPLFILHHSMESHPNDSESFHSLTQRSLRGNI